MSQLNIFFIWFLFYFYNMFVVVIAEGMILKMQNIRKLIFITVFKEHILLATLRPSVVVHNLNLCCMCVYLSFIYSFASLIFFSSERSLTMHKNRNWKGSVGLLPKISRIVYLSQQLKFPEERFIYSSPREKQ